VPAVAVDPVAGGAKIRRQAETLGWPVLLASESLTDEALRRAYEYCLTEEAREKARECADRAAVALTKVRETFIAALAQPVRPSEERPCESSS